MAMILTESGFIVKNKNNNLKESIYPDNIEYAKLLDNLEWMDEDSELNRPDDIAKIVSNVLNCKDSNVIEVVFSSDYETIDDEDEFNENLNEQITVISDINLSEYSLIGDIDANLDICELEGIIFVRVYYYNDIACYVYFKNKSDAKKLVNILSRIDESKQNEYTKPNKPQNMFKVGDLIIPTLNNQFDGMSTNEIWEVVEVNGYDKMNGYIYTIKPNNDAAKAYRSENSTDGEAEGFAEICGFENSPEEQEWVLANESKSIKEDADKNYNPVDTVDIAVDNVIENIVNSELGNLAQQIAALGKGYNADWCAVEADSPTSQAVVKALENLGDALKADLLANYNKNKSLKESIEDEYASITALADDCGENVFKEFSTGLRFRFINDDNAIKFMDKLREMNITFDEMATGVIRVDKVNLVSESFNDEVFEYNEHQYKVEKRHVYKRQVRTSYFDSYDEAKLDAEEWINDADKHLKIYAKGLTNSAFAYIYHWNGTEFEYIELINSETIEKERKSVKESFDYNENSEEDQGLFDGIGTQVVDTIFPGVQFEGREMEKLDDAIDKLIYVYKSVKARTAEPVK